MKGLLSSRSVFLKKILETLGKMLLLFTMKRPKKNIKNILKRWKKKERKK